MDISLTKLPWYAQIGAFVLLGCGAGGAFYYYYEMPARADMAGREIQLVALRADDLERRDRFKAYDWVFYLPPVILGVRPDVILFMLAVDLAYQYFVHTESIVKLPALSVTAK